MYIKEIESNWWYLIGYVCNGITKRAFVNDKEYPILEKFNEGCKAFGSQDIKDIESRIGGKEKYDIQVISINKLGYLANKDFEQ